MDGVSATRLELLARRTEIVLGQQGCDLLEQKRTALMAELDRAMNTVLAEVDALEDAATEARRVLGLAEAVQGPERVRSAALVARGELNVDAGVATVMGVRVPVIERKAIGRPRSERGYSLSGSPACIDLVAERFETVLGLVLALARRELLVRRLAAEIGRTTRRVNALELVVIPRLEHERDAIQATLDEREREDAFRLRRVMSHKDWRRGCA